MKKEIWHKKAISELAELSDPIKKAILSGEIFDKGKKIKGEKIEFLKVDFDAVRIIFLKEGEKIKIYRIGKKL